MCHAVPLPKVIHIGGLAPQVTPLSFSLKDNSPTVQNPRTLALLKRLVVNAQDYFSHIEREKTQE